MLSSSFADGLISVKLKKAGVGANFCIHKYFFERSDTWKNVRAEANDVKQESDNEDEPMEDGTESKVLFDPIDSRHLSSLPLIRTRLEKLLKSTPSNIHKFANLIVAIVRASDIMGLEQLLSQV